MTGIEVRPAPSFADVATMVGPKKPGSNVCWCLSHRVDSRTNASMVGEERGEYVRGLTTKKVKPGVLAYDGGEVVGWAAVAPRAELPFTRPRKIPHVDDLAAWSVWCLRVRPGHRGKGISRHLLEGAVAYAFAHGAPAVEGYPVDNQGKEGRPDDGLRRHPRGVRGGRVRAGGPHRRGVRRVPARGHAAPALCGTGQPQACAIER